jgi:hypothetical protein
MTDDQRYELYAWMCFEDGQWGIISGLIPELPFTAPMPLQNRRRAIAERLRPLAQSHGRQHQDPVRLVRLVEADTLEHYKPEVKK